MNKRTIRLALAITLGLWIAGSLNGCNTIEYMADGLHRDIAAYNQGNADARMKNK
jgi:hypothetical protein